MLVVGLVSASATPPQGYYSSAVGQTGSALKTALHAIVDDHTVIPYSSSSFDTQNALEVLDQDPVNPNHVMLIYSRRSEPKTTWPAWNREHLWPNSYGLDDVQPAYSDLHNLRAADQNVNSSRGNEFYDWSDTNSASFAFPAHPEAPLCSSDDDSWQPPASVRGDIARAVFYMAVRYEGDAPNEPDLELTDNTASINSAAGLMGKLSTLVRWHLEDPVDAAEQLRNDRVFSQFQHNRNPFVDHPQWVQALFIPRLTIQPTPSGIRLRWANTGVALTLETAIEDGAAWVTVSAPPGLDNQGWFVDLPVENIGRRYRLKF
ncbi:MAG: endonuclease [Verrucomicrobia bacterium]|nr:endonuclease [Verrucomicrobiota bacterium]